MKQHNCTTIFVTTVGMYLTMLLTLGNAQTIPSVLYVANAGSNNVSAYFINSKTGALTTVPGSPFPTGIQPQSIVTTNSGRFAYTANFGSNDISGFTISSGVLTPLSGSPFPTGAGPWIMAIDPAGSSSIYVANSTSNNVSGFAIDPSTGVLTPVQGSPFAAGSQPLSVALDPSGSFAYVAKGAGGHSQPYPGTASTVIQER